METNLDDRVYFNNRIKLSNLQKGQNVVKMTIVNRYNTNSAKDGVGLYKYKDPVDGEVYIHTRWVPDYAHYVFPVFDQLDLKAKWKLRTVVPDNWMVVSNEV